jgi:hypothetical protein
MSRIFSCLVPKLAKSKNFDSAKNLLLNSEKSNSLLNQNLLLAGFGTE